MFLLFKIVADKSKVVFDQLFSAIPLVNAAMDRADYKTAEKQLAEILPLFDNLNIPKQLAASLKYKAVLLAIKAAECLQDNLKTIEYCSMAVETSKTGNSISLEIFRKRGEAYLAVDEIDKALADFSFYKKEMAIYGYARETIVLQEQIEKLLPELWSCYCLYLSDKNTAELIWQYILSLAKLWWDLE
jgi:hypothetical protein